MAELYQGKFSGEEIDSRLDNAKRTCRFVIGTSTAGWTEADCDYLCDGEADDVEINAAIQALPETGGEIVILDGTYNITKTIRIDKSNVKLSGNGPSTVLERSWKGSGSNGVIHICAEKYGVILYGVEITKLQIATNGSIAIGSSDCGIYVELSRNCAITGINVKKQGGGIKLNASSACKIFNNWLDEVEKGISESTLPGDSSENIIIGNTINCTSTGIHIYSSYGNKTDNNIVIGNITNGGGIVMASSHKNVIIGNRVSNDEHYGIDLQNCDMNNVSGNICIDNTIGIRLYNGSDNNTVTDNICVRGSGQPGDYTSDQYTIYVAPGGTVPKNNLFVGNNIMGKNYVDNGTNNTWANNKFE